MNSEELKSWQSKSNLQHGHTVDGKYSAKSELELTQ